MEVKECRLELLSKVVETAHAVTISRAIWQWVGLCRLRKQGKLSAVSRTTLLWTQDKLDNTQDIIEEHGTIPSASAELDVQRTNSRKQETDAYRVAKEVTMQGLKR